jgi:carbon monoxide dehydrogenase subunit G
MKISGETTLHAAPDAVWAALNDPAVLVRTIPGCERLEATGPGSYRITVIAGVASVRGSFAGDIALIDLVEPESFTLRASAAGGPGTVSTDVKVGLAAAAGGATELSYDADAVVGGVIAGVGQRMLASVGRKMAGEFFQAVDDVLTGREPQAGAAGPAAVPDGGPRPADRPGVYTAPRRTAPAGGAAFPVGAAAGAGAALAGVLMGWLIGRRNR